MHFWPAGGTCLNRKPIRAATAASSGRCCPKRMHRETDIKVVILPEGERPGTPSKPAPATLPHPSTLGAVGVHLRYITLPARVQLKLATGRSRDEGDVAELIRPNPDRVDAVRAQLASVHA